MIRRSNKFSSNAFILDGGSLLVSVVVVQKGAKSDNSIHKKKTRTAYSKHVILRNLYGFMVIQRP